MHLFDQKPTAQGVSRGVPFALCAVFDARDEIAGNRIGGPLEEEVRRLVEIEAQIASRDPETKENFLWLPRRLVRAVQNGWRADLIQPLAAQLDRACGRLQRAAD